MLVTCELEVGKGELERAFSYYGPLRTVWIARNSPGFACGIWKTLEMQKMQFEA